MKRRYLIIAIVVVLIAAFIFWMRGRGTESTDDAQINAYIIPIIPKVAGYVTELHVTDNQHVAAGDPLVEIDPRDLTISRDQAKALVAVAQAQLINKQLKLKRQQSLTTLARSKETLEDALYTEQQAEA